MIVPWTERSFLGGFLERNVSVIVAPLHGAQKINFAKLPAKTEVPPFRRCWQVVLLTCNAQTDYKGRFEHEVDLYELCAH
jgi:hypothetical protein